MTSETWETTAVPILQYIGSHEDEDIISIGDLADGIQRDPKDVLIEIERLIQSGYLAVGELAKMMTGGDVRPWFLAGPRLGERGARAVGKWPAGDPYQDLLEALDRRIAEEVEPEERSRLQKLRAAVGDIGKGVAIGVLTEVLKRGHL